MNDVGLLAEELRSEDVEQRRRAAKILATLEEAAQRAAIELLNAISDPDEQVRTWSAESLDMLGVPAIDDAPAIAKFLLNTTHEDSQYYAITLLGRFGSKSADYLQNVIQHTEEKFTAVVRARAIWALARIVTPENKEEIIAVLMALKNDTDVTISAAATRTFARVQ